MLSIAPSAARRGCFSDSVYDGGRALDAKVEREKAALSALSELAVHIMDYVQAHGRVATRDMVRQHAASPNTAKATFANLVKKGLLVRHGAGRSIWYGLS